jgi:hypothetical protein
MLQLLDTDRPVIIGLLKRSFSSPDGVFDFVAPTSVSDAVRGQLRTTTRDSAVVSLFEQSVAANELPVVLYALAEHLPSRQDIRQLILTLSRRPGWYLRGAIALQPACEEDLQGLTSGEMGLEGLTNDYDPFIDADVVRQCVADSLRRVCFIRRRDNGKQLGTGFLVGKDRVLTCYHVVEGSAARDSDVALRVRGLEAIFDFARTSADPDPDPRGLRGIAIDEAFMVPFAPYSSADRDPENTTAALPAEHELDFALLRLVTNAGEERGHFELLTRDPEPHSPVIIAQHPGDPRPPEKPTRLLPLKLSFAQPGIGGLNANGTRIIYFNGTLPGSSGSPVFDRSGQIVALHHNRGKLSDNASVIAKNNRGVPIRAIVSALAGRRIQLGKSARASLPGPLESSQTDKIAAKTTAEATATAAELITALALLTFSQLKDLIATKLRERPDDIAAWAREPLSADVLVRWAQEKRRLDELRAMDINASP